MSKNKMFKQREVRVTEKFFTNFQITSSDVVTQLGVLGVTSTSLFGGASASIANLGDMFRLYRINAVKFKLYYSGTLGVLQMLAPPALLYVLPFGATAPVGVAELETDRAMGDLTDQWEIRPTVQTDVGGPNRCPSLKVKHSDLVVIDSASPAGWLATANDATQTNYGTLYLVKAFAGASTGVTNPYWTLQVEVDISFRDLIDPNLISRTVRPRQAINAPQCCVSPSSMRSRAPCTCAYCCRKLHWDRTDPSASGPAV